jgi:hypothetical protein
MACLGSAVLFVGPASLMLNSAPLSHGSASTRVAQKRRQAPKPAPRASTAAPKSNTTSKSNTTTPQSGATPKPGATSQAGATPQSNPAHTPPANAARASQTSRRGEPDLALEEMLAADSYSVYVELRRIGTLAQNEELKTGVAALGLFGGDETKPLTDLFRFVSDNSETLAESRVVSTFLPARTGLPQTLLAVELASPEAAIAFEPKFRRLLGEQVRAVKQAIAPESVKQQDTQSVKQDTQTVKQGAQAGKQDAQAVKPDPRDAAKQKADATQPPSKQKGNAVDFALRRAGRWLIVAESPFTLRALRGDESEPRFADSARFQAVRGRFASDALFVYVDTNVAQQGWALQMQKANEAQTETTLTATTTDGARVQVGVVRDTPSPPAGLPPPPIVQTTTTVEAPPDLTAPTPEMPVSDEEQPLEEGEGMKGEPAIEVEVTPPPKPTEEQLAVRGMGGVLRNLWGGIPRIPGVVALGVSLDRGALAVRLAVDNTPDGTVALIPFLPNIVSGPPVTADAASVAPADSELFFAASLDWTQVYNSTIGAAALNSGMMNASWGDESDGADKGERPPTAEQSIAAAEKLFGFKFKEDLLPALGNEVAFSMPLDTGDFGIRMGRHVEQEKKEEKDSEPGFLYIAALNDTEKVREILPRVLIVLGFVGLDEAGRAPEKRAGFEIRGAGSFSYTIINNFLVLGEVKAVRHCIDSYDKRQTLAASNSYRDSTSWQAKQKLAHLFVADTIMRNIIEATQKRSGESTDPVVRALLLQLAAARPEPASYEATNEGDVILHEMRLPISLIKSYAAAMGVAVKDAPVINGETMALYSLSRIVDAEEAFKNEKKKERYGTLEELFGEELLEKNYIEQMEYKIELNAVGERFEVNATPKTYGKSGRRSFFLDETGKVRAADRKGQPAISTDPTVEQ